MKNKFCFKSIFKILNSIFTTVAIISICTIISLNLKFIYRFIIYKFNLVNETGVCLENLISDYNNLINYLQNPFIKKLKFENFIMSNHGKIHFYEVKKIFLSLILIALIFILFNLFYIIICKIKKDKNVFIKIINNLNLSSNILIIFLFILSLSCFIDFSKAFIIFHKIFFKNNYWIFDERTDPIINALPKELFMIYSLVILLIIIIVIIFIKLIKKKIILDKNF